MAANPNSYRSEDGIIKAARAAKLPRWMYDTPEAWKALIRLIDQQCGPSDRKDAERYRWLRNQFWEKGTMCVVSEPANNVRLGADCPSGIRLDDAIDAAMSQSTAAREKA